MKVVLDTNVLVSGLLLPFSGSGEIVRMVAGGEVALCYDARVLAEYQEVLRRPRFSFPPAEVEDLLAQVVCGGTAVSARPLSIRLPDLDDEPFLEVGVAARARCLVTGNLRHYPSRARCGLQVRSPGEFLEWYRERRV